MQSEIEVKLRNGTTIVVPRTLSCITTHVLLEQEEWFEKELGFLAEALKPGMVCIDIGANYGTYSALIAQKIGNRGKLFAYEPATETRLLLEKTKIINNASVLTIIGAALSDNVRQGFLSFGTSSELNSLAESGSGEMVPITSLDREVVDRQWEQIDFIKIDAEGEENRIFDGGKRFFSDQSPLVMIEIKSHSDAETTVAQRFIDHDYSLFRLLGSSNILVPFHLGEKIDGYELNIFAAKADRTQELESLGLLVRKLPEPSEADFKRPEHQKLLLEQSFARGLGFSSARFNQLDPDYRMALAAYAVWRDPSVDRPNRCSALRYSLQVMRGLCKQAASASRLMTLARVAYEAGARTTAIKALQPLIAAAKKGAISFPEPFWPPSPRFDQVAIAKTPGPWAMASMLELFVRWVGFSNRFVPCHEELSWLEVSPYSTPEIVRRITLVEALADAQPACPLDLLEASPLHLNANLWRDGLVPGVQTPH